MTDEPARDHDQRDFLRRACTGDDRAFSELYRLHASAIYALALRMTGEPASAEDVLQDTFLRALVQGRAYRGEASLGHWLKRIAANAAIDRLRQARRLVALDGTEVMAAPAPRQPEVEEVLGLLRHLSPAARSVVWLHEMEGYSHTELATAFGKSESWSKSLLMRSLQKLKDLMEASR